MTHIVIIDTETTGLKNPQPIQIAYIICTICRKQLVPLNYYCQYFKPTKPIEPQATLIHGITDDDLADCPSIYNFELPFWHGQLFSVIGHNVSYDWRMLQKLIYDDSIAPNMYRPPLIDTLAIMKGYGKKIGYLGSYKLETLSKAFLFDSHELVQSTQHNALNDCLMTFNLVNFLLKQGEISPNDLLIDKLTIDK